MQLALMTSLGSMTAPFTQTSSSNTRPPQLAEQHCVPLQSMPSMSEQEIYDMLIQFPDLDGWTWQNHALEKSIDFGDFHETMAFINALAWVCHRENHHPMLTVTFKRCVVRFETHSVGGVSMNDFICAAKVNALLT